MSQTTIVSTAHARAGALVAAFATITMLAACTRDSASTPPDSTHVTSGLRAHAAATLPPEPHTPTPTGAQTGAHTASGATDTVAAGSAARADTTAWRASARSVGAVTFGMSLAAAARIAGGTAAHPPQGSCGFVTLRSVPRGARFMVSYDTLVRVDVDSATVPTNAGARVGMREDSVQRLYANRLRVTPHKYVRGGHYLTLVPGAPADTMHQLIFETDGDRVTRYRAGLAPYVGYVEGCG